MVGEVGPRAEKEGECRNPAEQRRETEPLESHQELVGEAQHEEDGGGSDHGQMHRPRRCGSYSERSEESLTVFKQL